MASPSGRKTDWSFSNKDLGIKDDWYMTSADKWESSIPNQSVKFIPSLLEYSLGSFGCSGLDLGNMLAR